jgi:hypothetical protein
VQHGYYDDLERRDPFDAGRSRRRYGLAMMNLDLQAVVRIPTKRATNSNRKRATDSDLKPAGIPI